MVRISGELYVDRISVMAWYKIVSVSGVKVAYSLLRWAGSAYCFGMWQWIPLASIGWCHSRVRELGSMYVIR